MAQADRSRGLTQFPSDGGAFPQEIAARVVVTFPSPVVANVAPLLKNEAIASPTQSQVPIQSEAMAATMIDQTPRQPIYRQSLRSRRPDPR